MFSQIFFGLQQDFKLAIIAPFICALFRLIFILAFAPDKQFNGQKQKWYDCFRYGFWWGMDFNSYILLFLFLMVTIPSAYFPAYLYISDVIKIITLGFYLTILYIAFVGKMIFYFHFQDIYNQTMRLGLHADKKNLVDIFFNQNNGIWILLGYIPYIINCTLISYFLLQTPILSYPNFETAWGSYLFNTLIVIGTLLAFYYFRYGGTLDHRKKPERDTIPPTVKQDVFFAKAVIDDLIAIELVFQQPVQAILKHSDAESRNILKPIIPIMDDNDPFKEFKRTTQGSHITKPQHIFFIVGESYTQAPFDPAYAPLQLVQAGQEFRNNPHTVSIPNFLPAGLVSQPAITSILAGIFDSNLEINEKDMFWKGSLPTSLPHQIQKLGYKTMLWYGGSISWASLGLFGKSMGFDAVMGGPDFCPPNSPQTWLGVYDHIFLEQVLAATQKSNTNEPVFHFVYTTSNHGPYTIPFQKYGFDPHSAMNSFPESMKKNHKLMADLGTYWYTDQALSNFVENIKQLYPDSLILVTGDHSRSIIPFGSELINQKEPSIREKFCTSFAMYHRDLSLDIFPKLTIGGHMNIMPTILELLAPKGHEYYSLFPSFLEPIDHIVTPYHWLTEDMVGYYNDEIAQSLTEINSAIKQNIQNFTEERNALCEITGWTIRHPELLIPKGPF